MLRGFQPQVPGSRVNAEIVMGDGPASEADLAEAAIARIEHLRTRRDEAAEDLEAAREVYAKWYNQKRGKATFAPGDWVLISTKNLRLKRPSKKLAEKYIGPYQIIEQVGTSGLAFKVRFPSSIRIHNVFNVAVLEPYVSREVEPTEPTDNPFDQEETFEVEEIVNHKFNGRRRLYLAKWVGFPSSDNTWQKISDFTDRSVITEYEQRLRS